jgi:hypothetical protein
LGLILVLIVLTVGEGRSGSERAEGYYRDQLFHGSGPWKLAFVVRILPTVTLTLQRAAVDRFDFDELR